MRRGTTPTITLTVDADLTGHAVEVTFRRPFMEPLTMTNDQLHMEVADDVTTITLTLTQRQTLAMHGPVEVQVRAARENVAIATDIGTIDVGRILREGVING